MTEVKVVKRKIQKRITEIYPQGTNNLLRIKQKLAFLEINFHILNNGSACAPIKLLLSSYFFNNLQKTLFNKCLKKERFLVILKK